ncbi:MAG: hypothetical protein ACRERC_00685 [Candidatus Binatia bacterium]
MTADWWTWRDPWELRLQRAALAALVYASFRAEPRFSAQPFPVGIAGWVDFSFLSAPAAWPWTDIALLAALACYVAGRAMPMATAAMAGLYIGAGALAYSQGSLQHRTQLLGLVLLGQFGAYVLAALRRRPAASGDALATLFSVEIIAAAYVLAGLMKVALSRGQWLAQVPMVVIDIAKAHGQAACTTGDTGLVARADGIAGTILAHPNLTRVLFAPAVLFELAAGLAPFGRMAAAIAGLCLLAMHRGIDTIMGLRFWEHEVLLLIYFVNAPYLLLRLLHAVGLVEVPRAAR